MPRTLLCTGCCTRLSCIKIFSLFTVYNMSFVSQCCDSTSIFKMALFIYLSLYQGYKWLQISCLGIQGGSSQYLPQADMLLSFFSPARPFIWKHLVMLHYNCAIWLWSFCVYCGWREGVMDVYIALRFPSFHFPGGMFPLESTGMWIPHCGNWIPQHKGVENRCLAWGTSKPLKTNKLVLKPIQWHWQKKFRWDNCVGN